MKKTIFIILLSLFLVSCSMTQRYAGKALREYRANELLMGYNWPYERRFYSLEVETHIINNLKQLNKYSKKNPDLIDFEPDDKFDMKRFTEDENFFKENTIIVISAWYYDSYKMYVELFEVEGKDLNIILKGRGPFRPAIVYSFYSFWFIMAKNTVIKKVNPTLLFHDPGY